MNIEARNDTLPSPARRQRRFRWGMQEVSGALGDLGTFLPHIIGAITVVGMAPASIFVTFGLFYALGGAFYGLPIAVQPMKAASAVVLIEPMEPGAIAAAGLVLGAFFFLVGVTGLVERLARIVPDTGPPGRAHFLERTRKEAGMSPTPRIAQRPMSMRAGPPVSWPRPR